MKKREEELKALKTELRRLKKENTALKAGRINRRRGPTVKAPPPFKAIFDKAEKTVGDYFESLKFSPSRGSIEISGERYILVRASALSLEFLNSISHFYRDRGQEEAIHIGRNILFDLAHMLGMEDARNFHKKMGLKDPISRLSAGPVHFAWSGWAFVEILPESRPSPDENYYIKYNHPYSFEAESWVKAKKKSPVPVCIMNSGYSSGWCEASFGVCLTSVEISCKAMGHKNCTFIMAPPSRIEQYLREDKAIRKSESIAVPSFLERKKIEEKIKSSLQEKEVLLKEIHHRVKNNLQIISSLLNLQAGQIKDATAREKYLESISRIKSMAIIHELLYRSKNLSTIKMNDYLKELVTFITQTYPTDKNVKVNLKVKMWDENIDLTRAIPCGIILNELLSNAFKHAFGHGKKGRVLIEISGSAMKKGEFRMGFEDNGVGLPDSVEPGNPSTLGLQLIKSLVEQLEGTMEITRTKGTRYDISF